MEAPQAVRSTEVDVVDTWEDEVQERICDSLAKTYARGKRYEVLPLDY